MGHGFAEDSTERVWRRNNIHTPLHAWRNGWKSVVSSILYYTYPESLCLWSAHFCLNTRRVLHSFISVKQRYPFPFLRSKTPSLQLSPYHFTIDIRILHLFTKTYTLPNCVTYLKKNVTTLLSNVGTVKILSLWSIYFPTCTIFSWWYCRNQPTLHLDNFFS